jgi:hypothetical protein
MTTRREKLAEPPAGDPGEEARALECPTPRRGGGR